MKMRILPEWKDLIINNLVFIILEVIFFITPYPGTELYEMAKAQGKIPDEEEYICNLGEQGESVRINFTEFTDDELLKIQESMINDLNSMKTNFIKTESKFPACISCYDLFSKMTDLAYLDWLVACGVIFDWQYEDSEVIGYESYPRIKFDIAV